VAVITVSSSVILIFILSILSGTVSACGTGVGGTAVGVTVGGGFVAVADNAVGVGGTVVGATVGGGLVGAETVTVGIGGTVVGVGGGVDIGVDAQAATKTTARMSTIIRLGGLDIFSPPFDKRFFQTCKITYSIVHR
jgi:hypothetical protein